MTRFGKMILRAGLAALALGVAGSASAAEYLATFKGTIVSSFDQTGEFGSAATSLDGKSFEAIYTLSYPTPGAFEFNNGSSIHYIRGGTQAGNASPVSAKLKINGVTQSVGGQFFGQAVRQRLPNSAGGVNDTVTYSATDLSDDGVNFYVFTVFSLVQSNSAFLSSLDLTAPLNYVLPQSAVSFDGFTIQEFNYRSGIDTRLAYGSFSTESLTISALGAVPEPASWAMMIAGFGLVGGALRNAKGRRRAKVTVVSA
jgi:PEP-CTERM motif